MQKKKEIIPERRKKETCRHCGGDASNGFNGLCESCEDSLRREFGRDCDTSNYD